jgi:hypothetical protein
VVGHRRVDGIGAAGANAHGRNPLTIDEGKRREVIDRAPDIFHTGGRVFEQTGHAAAFALVGSIIGERDKAFLREAIGVEARGLVLGPAARMHDDDRRIGLALRQIGRLEDHAGHVDLAVLERDGPARDGAVFVHSSREVCQAGDGSFIRALTGSHTGGRERCQAEQRCAGY